MPADLLDSIHAVFPRGAAAALCQFNIDAIKANQC